MLNETVRRLLIALVAVTLVILLGGASLFLLGHGRWSLSDALYMSVITVSTVGFQQLDGLNEVKGARAVTVTTILAGLGAVAYFQSALTALIVEGVIGQALRRRQMRKVIDGLSNHVVVAGVGSTGKHVIEELILTETPFVAIDRNREHLERLSQELTAGKMLYVAGDATEDHVLIEAGIERCKGLIAALTADPANLFVTLSARALNARARIVTKVVETEAAQKMLRAGANATVSPYIIGGRRLASEMVRPDVVEFLDQMMRDRDKNLRFEEIALPPRSAFAGQALKDVPIRRQASVLVVAVRGHDRRFLYNPGPEYLLEEGTVLVVLGETSQMHALRAMVADSVRPA